MLTSVSVLSVSEIIVKSLLYYPRKVPLLLNTQKNYFSTVYIGKVVLDIYMKFSTGSVTLTSQDNLSNKKKKQGRGSVVRRP